MDPRTISMEEGKQILKRCGIPQYDIDMLTEKWEVDASVEVMLRFPLMPGEDPTARCVSNKSHHPLVVQQHTTSERLGEQTKRSKKSNNQPISRAEQKPQPMEQRPGLYGPQKIQAPENKDLKKQLMRSVKPKVLPTEGEGTMMQHKSCGAFGHKERNQICPMKSSGGTFPFLPLSSNKEDKENLNPKNPQQLQTQGPISNPDRRKKHTKKPTRSLSSHVPKTRSTLSCVSTWEDRLHQGN
ncbi:uncharacterized protein LOC134476682 [Cavia porcellus]|uniref:uncharacterized protein LOC134476682 n=1 Tax=Cavia porcellus TaxID=10141 RepID=UPI002FE2D012